MGLSYLVIPFRSRGRLAKKRAGPDFRGGRAWSPGQQGNIFLDDLHLLLAISPEYMLTVHSVHIKIYSRLQMFTQGLEENVDLSTTEPQDMSHH